MQFRVKAPLATQIESAFVLVTAIDGLPSAIFNVNGGITHIGSPFVLPGPGFSYFPDTYGLDLPETDISLPDKPDKITLGE